MRKVYRSANRISNRRQYNFGFIIIVTVSYSILNQLELDTTCNLKDLNYIDFSKKFEPNRDAPVAVKGCGFSYLLLLIKILNLKLCVYKTYAPKRHAEPLCG